MDPIQQEQIAAARYALIAPVVSRQTPFAPGELAAWLKETSSREYDLPGSVRQTVSMRTLERYLALYRRGGWDALKPKGRPAGPSKLPSSILQKAIVLRQERPERSVEQIIFLLEESGIAPYGSVASSTLARHLRKAGLSRKQLACDSSATLFNRFEAAVVMMLWQSDFKHFVHLPDPKDPKRKRKAMLCAVLDDCSRFIVHAQFYWDEKLPRLEDCLKKAILKHGVPETFYCDNGSVFSSHHLARICGKLGIRLVHSRPYRPQGRGKIERFFQFVDTSFRPEVQAAMSAGGMTTLDELNEAFQAWLEAYYHERKHGGTNESPRGRFERDRTAGKRPSLLELNEVFLWEERRTVNKTGCVSSWATPMRRQELQPATK
uniref:DDE-type integrase/transposase/recombinase n=1 Tax=Paenibacillus cremeus TaxID=2163881 RepID=UPI0021BD4DE0|nr:DDE-type integrase/transposase/recombinase [Paenibacillus cremeus]